MKTIHSAIRLGPVLALAVVGTGTVLGATNAQAQDAALPWKTASIAGGLYLSTFNSDLTIDSSTLGQGTSISLEDDLGLDETVTSFRVDGFWRFFPRHRFDVSYYTLSREGTRNISRTLQIGDRTFTVGTTVNSSFDLDVYQGAYSFSVVQNQNFDIALSLGAYVGDVGFSVNAAGIGAESANALAPLPVVGGRADYAITDDLFVRLNGRVFFLETGDVRGSLADIFVGLDYDVTENIGAGVGYNYVDINANTTDDNADFDLGYSFSAVMLYARLSL